MQLRYLFIGILFLLIIGIWVIPGERISQEITPTVPDFNSSVVTANCDICAGGSVDLTINTTSGTGPFTYQWSTTETTQTITVTAPGTYYVTITDASGVCAEVEDFVITEVDCCPSGGITTNGNCTNGFSWVWSQFPSGCVTTVTRWYDANSNALVFTGDPFIPPSGTNDYYAVVTCTNFNPDCDYQSADFTADCDPCTNPTVTISGGCNGFSSNISGSCPSPSYQWLLNGSPISGATSSSYNPPTGMTGTITLQVNCSNGCSDVSNAIFINCNLNCNCTISIAQHPTNCEMVATLSGTGCDNYDRLDYIKYNNTNGCSGSFCGGSFINTINISVPSNGGTVTIPNPICPAPVGEEGCFLTRIRDSSGSCPIRTAPCVCLSCTMPCNSTVVLNSTGCDFLTATISGTPCPSATYTFINPNNITVQSGASNIYNPTANLLDGTWTVVVSGCPNCGNISSNTTVSGCNIDCNCDVDLVYNNDCTFNVNYSGTGCNNYNLIVQKWGANNCSGGNCTLFFNNNLNATGGTFVINNLEAGACSSFDNDTGYSATLIGQNGCGNISDGCQSITGCDCDCDNFGTSSGGCSSSSCSGLPSGANGFVFGFNGCFCNCNTNEISITVNHFNNPCEPVTFVGFNHIYSNGDGPSLISVTNNASSTTFTMNSCTNIGAVGTLPGGCPSTVYYYGELIWETTCGAQYSEPFVLNFCV